MESHGESIVNPGVSDQFEVALEGWFGKDDIDQYDPKVQKQYDNLVELARLTTPDSLLAASLVDVHDSGNYREDPKLRITAAENIKKTVNGWYEFIDNNPEESALAITRADVFLFELRELDIQSLFKDPSSRKEHYLKFIAPLQANADVYRGHFDGNLSRSIGFMSENLHDHRGGYRLFTIRLSDIDHLINTPFTQALLPPITMGREAIASLCEMKAEKESYEGGTVHRSHSLAYVIWRLSQDDVQLSDLVEDKISKYGLEQIWPEQYKQEIGAKAAHVLMGGYTKENTKGKIGKFLFLKTSAFWDEEYSVFKPTDTELETRTVEQCRRLGLKPKSGEIEQALSFVVGDKINDGVNN
jgi:hypothetical protein